MTTATDVAALLAQVEPSDAEERRHLRRARDWLATTDDVFRRVPPRTPPVHLVAYAVLRDPGDGAVLLVDHRRSGLWLPPGGHLEVGEHPADAARRELHEELGLERLRPPEVPAFLTVSRTVGPVVDRHTDVTLWYVLAGSRDDVLSPDPREVRGTAWWTPADVEDAGPGTAEPHLGRFVAKLGSPPTA